MTRLLTVLLMAMMMSSATLSDSARAEDSGIVISDAWAKPTLRGTRTGAVYLTLTNRGSASDHLVAISTPVAERAELHEDVMTKGVMSMKPVADLALAPGANVAITPGHYHVMLIGVRAPLAAGQSFPLTLTFDRAGPVEASVTVTRAPPMSGSMPMKMP
jgi:periplasmic copper chaperone A